MRDKTYVIDGAGDSVGTSVGEGEGSAVSVGAGDIVGGHLEGTWAATTSWAATSQTITQLRSVKQKRTFIVEWSGYSFSKQLLVAGGVLAVTWDSQCCFYWQRRIKGGRRCDAVTFP